MLSQIFQTENSNDSYFICVCLSLSMSEFVCARFSFFRIYGSIFMTTSISSAHSPIQKKWADLRHVSFCTSYDQTWDLIYLFMWITECFINHCFVKWWIVIYVKWFEWNLCSPSFQWNFFIMFDSVSTNFLLY